MLTVVAVMLMSVLMVGLQRQAAHYFRRRAAHYLNPATVDRSEAVRRVLRHIVRRPIAELADADAAVVRGAAIAVDDPLVAPLSGRSCIGYHLLVRDSSFGEILVDHACCGRFAIADDTGKVLVSSEGLELAATEAPGLYLSVPLPPFIAHRVPLSWRGQVVFVTEGVLLAGAQVAACGVMQTAIGASDLYREGCAYRMLIASPTFPLVASPDRDLEVPSPSPIRPEDVRELPASK
jgi:hypothetical protein